jgi:septal ring-binding cell division protein DamX
LSGDVQAAKFFDNIASEPYTNVSPCRPVQKKCAFPRYPSRSKTVGPDFALSGASSAESREKQDDPTNDDRLHHESFKFDEPAIGPDKTAFS